MWNKLKNIKVDGDKAIKVCFGISAVGFIMAGACVIAKKRGVF